MTLTGDKTMTDREKQIDKAQEAFKRMLQMSGTAREKALAIHELTKSHKINGLVIWKGLSEIDGKTPLVTIAHINPGYNAKIGEMTQIYYLVDSKESPVTIAQSGQDFAICGNCKHRPVNLGSCYVTLFQGVRALTKAYNDNHYFDLSNHFEITLELLEIFKRPIRFGAYGDPASMPYDKQLQMAEAVDFKLTGYTHQWNDFNDKFADFKTFLHASVDNDEETETAKKAGWNYYKISTCDGAYTGKSYKYENVNSELQLIKEKDQVICPNTASAGKVSCASCLKCSGNSKNGSNVINALHGARVKKYLNVNN